MKIVGGVDIEQTFTPDDIIEMFKNGRLRTISEQGYCTQGGEDGLLRFVPFWESLAFRTEQNMGTRTYASEDFTEVMRQDVEAEHPILRTTPQEKVARMALRIMAEVKRTGRVTGLNDNEMATIMGESWRVGEPVTGEAIQKLSEWLMGRAEVDNRDADSHRVTRAHMTA